MRADTHSGPELICNSIDLRVFEPVSVQSEPVSPENMHSITEIENYRLQTEGPKSV